MSTNKRFQWGAFTRFLVSSSGIVLSLIGVVACFIMGFAGIMMGTASYYDLYPFSSLGWAGLTVFLLLLPSAWNSLMRLLNKDHRYHPVKPGIRLPSLLLLCLPLLLWVGDILSADESLAWMLLLPPLQVLVIIIPLWWLIEFGRRGLKQQNEPVAWDVFSFGTVITQPLVILLEFFVILAVLLVLGIWVMNQPELVMQLQVLSERITQPGLTPEMLEKLVVPYLQMPAIMIGIILIFAVMIPFLEEILKPLALWSFIKRDLTPADGFVIGLMCGAVFGLLESMGMLSTPLGYNWTLAAIGRIGTGILHSGTAALVGWGMVSAWRGSSFLRFLLAYLFVAVFHGLWNFASIYIALVPVVNKTASGTGSFQMLQANAPFIMTGVSLLFVLIVAWGNRVLRKSESDGSDIVDVEVLPEDTSD